MELTEYRDRFPILEHTTYLINHSLGAMPAAAEERLLEFARSWRERGIRAWAEGWWEMPMTVGDQVGRIIGAPPGSTVMHQNVAVAEAIVVSCFRPVDPRRNRVVYEEGNFPSVRYIYQAQSDLEVVVVPNDRAIVEAIDERTLLVPITHVLFKTAEIQDVEAIVHRAHEVGAHVVLDAYQSVGIVPLGVAALNVDFAVGGSVKWLCGGPGNGWLYVRPDLIERLEPEVTGWQAHARPFAFEPELEYAEGIARFLTGTPNVPALYAATPGFDLIEEIGVERIRANSLRQTQLLIDGADTRGFEVRSPREPARRGGTVTVHVPDFEAVHRELGERQILCDFRPGAGIRLGPHYFTSDEELEFALDQIAGIVATGAHERWLGATAARYSSPRPSSASRSGSSRSQCVPSRFQWSRNSSAISASASSCRPAATKTRAASARAGGSCSPLTSRECSSRSFASACAASSSPRPTNTSVRRSRTGPSRYNPAPPDLSRNASARARASSHSPRSSRSSMSSTSSHSRPPDVPNRSLLSRAWASEADAPSRSPMRHCMLARLLSAVWMPSGEFAAWANSTERCNSSMPRGSPNTVCAIPSELRTCEMSSSSPTSSAMVNARSPSGTASSRSPDRLACRARWAKTRALAKDSGCSSTSATASA